MPPCIFCGAHVLPCNVGKATDGERKLPPVCGNCDLHLDVLTQDRVDAAVKEALENFELPKDTVMEAIAEHIDEFVKAKQLKWEITIVERIDKAIEEELDKALKCRPSVTGNMDGAIKELVAEALKGGLASLMSGARPLARGKKQSDSKTSQEGV